MQSISITIQRRDTAHGQHIGMYELRAAARDAVWRDRLSAIEAGHLRPAGRRWFRGGAPIDPLAEALDAAWDAAWDAWGAAGR